MKNLLFTGLISVGFLMIGNSQMRSDPLFKNFTDTDFLDSPSLQRFNISTITCSEINALSEDEFDTLIKKIQSLVYICYSRQGNILEGTPEYKEWEEAADKSFSQVYLMLSIIHKCRSIVPVYNRMIIEILKEISDKDFECFVEKVSSQYAYFDHNHPSLSDFDRIFVSAKDEYLLHPNNVEKLRKMRDHISAEQK